MKRGEVWLVELDKRRPAIIVRVVPWLDEVHVVPVTSTIRGLPSEIAVPQMPKAAVANAQRLTLISKTQLVRRVATMPESALADLAHAVCTVLGC